jgi:transposase-like protein
MAKDKWEVRFACLLAEHVRGKRRGKVGRRWYADETYLKVKGIVSRRRESAVLYEEMRVDPSESPCRRRLQTARSCFSQKLRW